MRLLIAAAAIAVVASGCSVRSERTVQNPPTATTTTTAPAASTTVTTPAAPATSTTVYTR